MHETKFYFHLASPKYTVPPPMHQSSCRGDPSVEKSEMRTCQLAPFSRTGSMIAIMGNITKVWASGRCSEKPLAS
jgi:hypothetical protein